MLAHHIGASNQKTMTTTLMLLVAPLKIYRLELCVWLSDGEKKNVDRQ